MVADRVPPQEGLGVNYAFDTSWVEGTLVDCSMPVCRAACGDSSLCPLERHWWVLFNHLVNGRAASVLQAAPGAQFGLHDLVATAEWQHDLQVAVDAISAWRTGGGSQLRLDPPSLLRWCLGPQKCTLGVMLTPTPVMDSSCPPSSLPTTPEISTRAFF